MSRGGNKYRLERERALVKSSKTRWPGYDTNQYLERFSGNESTTSAFANLYKEKTSNLKKHLKKKRSKK